jgi:hypothetical protein
MKYIVLFILLSFSLTAQEMTKLDSLKQKIRELENRIEQNELEDLRIEAEKKSE